MIIELEIKIRPILLNTNKSCLDAKLFVQTRARPKAAKSKLV